MSAWKNRIVEHIRDIPLPESEMKSAIFGNSLPIISFGDFITSRYLTLGLNPSSIEYKDERGLAQLSKFGIDSWTALSDKSLLSDDKIYEVYIASSGYFNQGMNPYSWFDYPQITLSALGASYGSGMEENPAATSSYTIKASHIDLTPWTTRIKWSNTSPEIREKLIKHNREFLLEQLMDESIEMILILGRQTLDEFKKSMRNMGYSLRESAGTPFRIAKEAQEVEYRKIVFGSRMAFYVSQSDSAWVPLSRNEERRTSRRNSAKRNQSREERTNELRQIFQDFAEYIEHNR